MKKVLSLIIVLTLFCTLLCTPQAAAIVADPAPDTSTPSDEYAVVIKAKDRSSWQLTTEELNAPTEELVKSILASPYILALSCSNTPDIDPYAVLSMYFNGLRELESREDASSVMLSLLAELTLSKTEWDSLDQLYLMELLSKPVYFDRLTDSEKTTYIRLRINRTDIVSVQSSDFNYALFFADRYYCTFTVNNSATHTRTYSAYEWRVTEQHTPNVKTGNCIGCGLKGPFSYARG